MLFVRMRQVLRGGTASDLLRNGVLPRQRPNLNRDPSTVSRALSFQFAADQASVHLPDHRLLDWRDYRRMDELQMYGVSEEEIGKNAEPEFRLLSVTLPIHYLLLVQRSSWLCFKHPDRTGQLEQIPVLQSRQMGIESPRRC